MKILIYTDPHFSQFSSIVRSRGKKYSTRLEHLIDGINWAEGLALAENCNAVFVLGDFFDKPELNAEELTALKEVKMNGLSHIFVCGNHELGRVNNEFSSAHLFSLCPNTTVIDTPCNYQIEGEDVEIAFLPYIRNPENHISTYFNELEHKCSKRIMFAHVDLKDVQMGEFLSTEGFPVKDIEDYCDLFIDGHLHNGMKVSDKIMLLGDFSGQNFSGDASKYPHCACILDTETLHIDYYENPYAFNFYKFSVNSQADCVAKLSKLKNNAIVTVKCFEKDSAFVKDYLNKLPSVIESRVLLEMVRDSSIEMEQVDELTNLDHIKSFSDYVQSRIGTDDVTMFELAEISK